jgi:hypothetical protein
MTIAEEMAISATIMAETFFDMRRSVAERRSFMRWASKYSVPAGRWRIQIIRLLQANYK